MEQNNDNVLAIIREIFTGLSVIGGFIGILYAGITALLKEKTARDISINAANIEKQKQKEDSKAKEVELAAALNAIQEKVVASLEARFVKLEEELSETKTELHKWQNKYTALAKKRAQEHAIVMKLVSAIQAGFDARAANKNDACVACMNQDSAILKKLEEVKTMLEQELTA